MPKRIYPQTVLIAAFCCAAVFGAVADEYIRPGNYSGLFYEADGYWQQSSGIVTLKVTPAGKYSGKLQVGPDKYSFSGQLTPEGTISQGIPRRDRNPMLIELAADPENVEVLFGTVEDGVWIADLYCDLEVFDGKSSISPDAGKYTMAIPGDYNSATEPGGDGCGTITVDGKGRVKFSGTLAEGTKVTQSATVSRAGLWPFYTSLYKGGGSLYGWLSMNPNPDDELTGDVTWIKPRIPSDWYYPDGFALIVAIWGSRYAPPAKGELVLGYSDGAMEFNGGNLVEGFTNQVLLDSNNKVYNVSSNTLQMKIKISTGMFSGKVADPLTGDMLPFWGVLLQKFGTGAGYFEDYSLTGEVWLEQW